MTTTTAQRIRPEPHFPVLDSLRAIGALAVLTTHTAFQSGDYGGHGVWGVLLARLDVGVAIFFVLSGFLLSRPHLARAAAEQPGPSKGRYYWKRFLRIYPVYAVTVVLALTLVPGNDDTDLGDWVTALLLADTYVDDRLPHGLTQMWSLAVEVAFYLLLPFIMMAALGRRNRALRPGRVWTLVVVMTGVSLAWHLGLAAALDDFLPGMPTIWLPAFTTWFAVGIALALTHVQHSLPQPPPRPARLLRSLAAMPGTCWLMTAGMMLMVATPVAGPALLIVGTQQENVTKHLLYAAVGGLVVLTGIFPDEDSRYQQVMSRRFLRHLGHISYSTFCIHLPVLHLVMGVTGYTLFGGHGLQIWSLTLVLSLVASELLYRLVERPAMRLRNVRRRPHEPSVSQPNNPPQTATTR